MAKIYSEKPSYCCMFHISTGLFAAEFSKQLKAWRADRKANRNVFNETKLQFPRFRDVKYY